MNNDFMHINFSIFAYLIVFHYFLDFLLRNVNKIELKFKIEFSAKSWFLRPPDPLWSNYLIYSDDSEHTHRLKKYRFKLNLSITVDISYYFTQHYRLVTINSCIKYNFSSKHCKKLTIKLN